MQGRQILKIHEGSQLKVSQLLAIYRDQSGVPDDALSRLLLSRYHHFERQFSPGEFRRLYMQLQWATSLFNRENAKGMNSPGNHPPSTDRLDSHILRILLTVREKNLSWGDEALKSFITALAGPTIQSEMATPHAENEELYRLVEQFNQAGQEGGKSEAGWIILPLEDREHPGYRAFLRYNVKKPDEPVSCSIEGWLFHWLPSEARVMYYSPPHVPGHEEKRRPYHEINVDDQLLNRLKAVNFERVEELRLIQDFDGFSIIGGLESLELQGDDDAR